MKKNELLLTAVLCLTLPVLTFTQSQINCDTIYTSADQSEYILPYPPGTTYTVTQSNCHPTGGHNLTFAYDFNTAIGDTIIACRSGVVTFVNDQYTDTDWTSGHENNVFIRHADGTRIRYTHLRQGGVLVSANEEVEQGQPIGISGNSGNTGGFPHLHLAAFKDGSSFNGHNTIPLNFCNTNDPVNDQNLLIQGQAYTAFDKNITALEEPKTELAIAIYPNPVRTKLIIDFHLAYSKPSLIQLYNNNGVMVYNSNLKASQSSITIPVNRLSPGIYFLVVKSNFTQLTKRILISTK